MTVCTLIAGIAFCGQCIKAESLLEDGIHLNHRYWCRQSNPAQNSQNGVVRRCRCCLGTGRMVLYGDADAVWEQAGRYCTEMPDAV